MTMEEIKEKISSVLKSYGVTRASIFGSTARGVSTAHDVDILVEFGQDIGLLEFIELKLKLEDILGAPVDLVEFDALKPRLKESILRGQVVVYGA